MFRLLLLGPCLILLLRRSLPGRNVLPDLISCPYWCWGPVPTVQTITFACLKCCCPWLEGCVWLLCADAVRLLWSNCGGGLNSILNCS